MIDMSDDTNNPVYKLVTDKLLLVLINALIRSILENKSFTKKVSQCSLATRLRCDGILNDKFVTQPPMSPTVNEF